MTEPGASIALALPTAAARWQLDAHPTAVWRAAGAWRDLAAATGRTASVIAPGADSLTKLWRGGAGQAYDRHRRGVQRDLTAVARAADDVAGTLAAAAQALDAGQRRLAMLRADAGAFGPVREGPDQITFYPPDAASADRITALAGEADAVQSSIGQTLLEAAVALRRGYVALGQVWSNRSQASDSQDPIAIVTGGDGPPITRNPPGPVIIQPRPPGDSPDWPDWPGGKAPPAPEPKPPGDGVQSRVPLVLYPPIRLGF